MFGVDSGDRKYRVRLKDPSQYHLAVTAHDDEKIVLVRGMLTREGNLHWMYDARITSVHGADESSDRHIDPSGLF